jgi:hypothetical protein
MGQIPRHGHVNSGEVADYLVPEFLGDVLSPRAGKVKMGKPEKKIGQPAWFAKLLTLSLEAHQQPQVDSLGPEFVP